MGAGCARVASSCVLGTRSGLSFLISDDEVRAVCQSRRLGRATGRALWGDQRPRRCACCRWPLPRGLGLDPDRWGKRRSVYAGKCMIESYRDELMSAASASAGARASQAEVRQDARLVGVMTRGRQATNRQPASLTRSRAYPYKLRSHPLDELSDELAERQREHGMTTTGSSRAQRPPVDRPSRRMMTGRHPITISTRTLWPRKPRTGWKGHARTRSSAQREEGRTSDGELESAVHQGSPRQRLAGAQAA